MRWLWTTLPGAPTGPLALPAVVHSSKLPSMHLLAGLAVRERHLRGRKELGNQELFFPGGNGSLLHLRDLHKSSNPISRAWIRSLCYKRPQNKAALLLFTEPPSWLVFWMPHFIPTGILGRLFFCPLLQLGTQKSTLHIEILSKVTQRVRSKPEFVHAQG